MQQSVAYGTVTIEYDLSFQERDTLAIHVHPDQRVTVEAPQHTALDAIQDRVRKRARWILKQQREFSFYPDPPYPRSYVSGESHRFLGKQYRLRVSKNPTKFVKLQRGWLHVGHPNPEDTAQVGKQVEAWLRAKAKQVFAQRLRHCYPKLKRLEISWPTLNVRSMQTRWGSCTADGVITLNPLLIRVPLHLIDYVIIHELVHLKIQDHGPRFAREMERVLPGWIALREELNRYDFN